MKYNIRNKNVDHSLLELGTILEMLEQILWGTGVSKKNGLGYALIIEYMYQPVGIFCVAV